MLDDSEYLYICSLVKQVTGIALDLSKKYLIDARLTTFCNEYGFKNVKLLVNELVLTKDISLKERVSHSLLTHETLFFRDGKYFNALFNEIIPQYKLNQNLNIWSAACSTGQEPYSISMAISEAANVLNEESIKIIASDISPKAIKIAAAGIYKNTELSRGVSDELLVKYFKPLSDEHWQVKEQIKQRITFKVLNLMSSAWSLPKLDIVFIRNVLIYFDIEQRKIILNNIKNYLTSGGLVITGTGEDISNMDKDFKKMITNSSVFYILER